MPVCTENLAVQAFTRLKYFWIVCLLSIVTTSGALANWSAQQMLSFSVESCRGWAQTTEPAATASATSLEKSSIEARGIQIGIKHRLLTGKQTYLEFDVIEPPGRPVRFINTLYQAADKPLLQLSLSPDCGLQYLREIVYNDKGQALKIISRNAELGETGEPVWLNPALVFAETVINNGASESAPVPVRIGMVDSGVNYRLPEINRRLARDRQGHLIGYDFWDMDDLPFDAHPSRSEFFIRHHGTRTASLLLREAPGIELVPYRYPRPDMSRMQSLIEHANRHDVNILGLPLGSNKAKDWIAFEAAARAFPHMLFIVSAGNDGRDIDQQAVYPAVLTLDNMLVVTSADDFVRPAERTNWGSKSVDFLIPAENISLLDYSGDEIKASGSSYAVARLAALAGRIKQAHRDWQASQIIDEIRHRYTVKGIDTSRWVSAGYIADPLVGADILKIPVTTIQIEPVQSAATHRLALDILVLDARWSLPRLTKALHTGYELLAQCGIEPGEITVNAMSGDDYLRDLATGSAQSLLKVIDTQQLRVVFARDTRMAVAFKGEAFGAGNTRGRPWLRNSVWLMADVEDEGIALAHELYHVIANSGTHVENADNLMQSRTRVGSTTLTPEQCQRAQAVGLANGLLERN